MGRWALFVALFLPGCPGPTPVHQAAEQSWITHRFKGPTDALNSTRETMKASRGTVGTGWEGQHTPGEEEGAWS